MMAAMPAFAQSTITLKAPQAPVASHLKGAIQITPGHAATQQKAPAKAEADEDLAMVLKYCRDPYSAYQINTGQIGLGIMFPKSMMAEYKGATITSINVCSPINNRLSSQSSYVNSLTECKVFVTESLGGTPISETEGTISNVGLDYTPVTLSTPYTITGDKDVYVCVMWDKVTATDFPIVADGYQPQTNYSGYLYSRLDHVDQNGSPVLQAKSEWKQFNQYVGNMCLTATIKGDFLPQNLGSVVAEQMPASVKPGEEFEYAVLVLNDGANKIKNVDLSLKIGDQEVQTVTSNMYANDGTAQTISIGNSEYGVAFGKFVSNIESQSVPYTAYISKVNGVDNANSNRVITGSLVSLSKGYPRNIVVEELTSTTCSMCPIGITGMETMKEKYGADGRFIPIAVHCPIPQAGDPMNICRNGYEYYDFMLDIQAAGVQLAAPTAYFMRNLANQITPTPEDLEKEFNILKDVPAVVEVKAALAETDDTKKVKLDVDVTPVMDLAGNYGISYTIVEDNVGPHVQTNGFSGYSDEQYYGWGSKPSSVSMKFNDVARRGSIYHTAPDSEIKGFKADTPVNYSTTVDLTYVSDLTNYSVVAMLINKDNGNIENACIVKSPTTTSVEGIEAEATAPIAVGMQGALQMLQTGNVYSVDGRMVAKNANGLISLPAGIYLVATPNGNAKVMVR